MILRLFNALIVAILVLFTVVAAIFIGRDLMSFVSAYPQASSGSAESSAKVEGHIVFSQGGKIAKATGNGGAPTFITQGPIDTTPVWSPDGANIAFIALNAPDRVGVFVARADGTGEHKVAPATGLYSRPTWSPDGKRLAFRDSSKDRQGLYTVNVDGSELQRIYEGNINTPAWSPDGATIAFSFNKTPTTGGVFLVQADGANPRLLIEGRFGELTWSPRSDQLAVRSMPKDSDEELLLVEVRSGKAVRLAVGVASGSWSPSWSPDGKMIALVLKDGEQKTLAILPPLAGGRPRDLLLAYNLTTPVWSADSAKTMVSAEQQRGDEPVLIRVTVDGSGIPLILAIGEFPSWAH
ncbi:MAG: hypothetical protein Q7O66_04610 [Dehalococcoidia bacterium]|nr:hypothetical protein [Dehalococcoidia bacterium]